MPRQDQFKTKEEYNKWYRQYREKNRKKLRKYCMLYNRAWRKKNKSNTSKKWKARNPDKVHAHNKLYYAVKTGKIKKLPCEKCGREKSVGHHPDYLKPLNVIWLCKICHRKEHYSLCG